MEEWWIDRQMDRKMGGWMDRRMDGCRAHPAQCHLSPSAHHMSKQCLCHTHVLWVLLSPKPYHRQLHFAPLLPLEAIEVQGGWWHPWGMHGLCRGSCCEKCPWGAGGAWGWAPCPGGRGVCAPSCSTVGLVGALSPPNPSWGHPWSIAPSTPTPGSKYLSPHPSPRVCLTSLRLSHSHVHSCAKVGVPKGTVWIYWGAAR